MRVILADDAVLFREGLARLLAEAEFDVIGQASTAPELFELVRADPPDAVLIDIKMPPEHKTEGLEAAHRIRAEFPDVGVLVLSQYLEPHYAMRLVEDVPRGSGYVLKDAVMDIDQFCENVRRVAKGETFVDSAIVGQLVMRRRDNDPIALLSDREREVLGLMAEGRSNHAIAERLVLTVKTVEAHVHSIFTKLGLEPAPDDHRRVLAVLAFLRA